MLKRLFVHAGAFNLGLSMRTLFGVGTPRGLQGRLAAITTLLNILWTFMTTPRRRSDGNIAIERHRILCRLESP